MGQTLLKPITDTSTNEDNDKRVMYGASCMQGWRTSDAVAKYSGTELHKKIMDTTAFERGRYRDAIRMGYYGIDQDLKKDSRFDHDTSGSTAVAALLTKDNVLYVSNAGDSRAVISTKDGRAIPLTQDHKPKHTKEALRIKNAGGFVENGRVNGSLALSRALGDFKFKNNTQLAPEQQAVTAEPDIIEHLLTDHDEFVVLACDGIWDCLSNQQVIDFVRYKLCEHKSLGPISEELMHYCLAEKGNISGIGCDNMTVIIVAFLRKRKPQEWYDWMAQKTKPQMPAKKAILLASNSDKDAAAATTTVAATANLMTLAAK
ncbi:hypothetical protein [Parasitella parasitica]|uniref:protein-serine/threonine phosphatase n=1 Tax=Parasitella parasitica TaxID=35722 RepID=A0A0B7MUG2_9FUNG|nr:hypothetical protein [Parasitella parasitica]